MAATFHGRNRKAPWMFENTQSPRLHAAGGVWRMLFRLLILCVLWAGAGMAQFSAGLKGGVPLTDFISFASNPTQTIRSKSSGFILGPEVELHLPAGFGVEFDALYRNFNYKTSTNLVDALLSSSASHAWEFPLLIKYKVPSVIVRPYLAAGFAFDRWTGLKQVTNVIGVTNSHVGVTNTGVVLGAGFEIHALVIRISPEVRFTRWGAKDLTDLGGLMRSSQNQAEFLIGVTF
jgi:hypothetical protein